MSNLDQDLAILSASGLCFHGPDGTDYDFTAAGIAAAARDVAKDSSLPPRAPEGRREVSKASSGGTAGAVVSEERIEFIVGLVERHDLGGAELATELKEALERARVVGVLDASILNGTIRSWQITHHVGMGDFAHAVWLSPRAQVFYGSDHDAARAAAAKAIEEGAVR